MRIAKILLALVLILGLLAAGGWGYLRWQSGIEAERLFGLLEIREGSLVGEIGAGDGSLTVKAARLAGPEGRVYSTEIEPKKQQAIRDAAAAASLENVDVRAAMVDSTNLPPDCCDALFLRHVYHHLSSPEPFLKSLFQASRPGARLAVIDFSPGGLMGWLPAVEGVPEDRGGHGISPDLVARELSEAGFEIVERIDDWHLADFCIIARRPAAVAGAR